MKSDAIVEAGQYGRLIVARLKPNQDLIESIEQICIEHHIRRAVVRGVVGSLVDAVLMRGTDAAPQEDRIAGPGVEILNVYGEVNIAANGEAATKLTGVVANTAGKIFAGRFKRSQNLSFITIEASLQEWLAVPTSRIESDSVSNM